MAENALQHQHAGDRDIVGLHEHDILLVEQNFDRLLTVGEAFSQRFYQRLITQFPQLLPLFKSVNIEGQHKKLLASIVLLIQHLRDSEMMVDYLQGLGVRHQQYGVEAEHFLFFIDNWIAVVAEFTGQDWNSSLEQAWRQVLTYVVRLMQPSASHSEQEVTTISAHPAVEAEYALIPLAIAQTATPMLIIDLNLVVRYINAAAESLLHQYQRHLQDSFPELSTDTLLNCSLQPFVEQLPFPIEWLQDVKSLPRSLNLPNTVMDLKLTISTLYKQEKAQGFLFECYPLTAESAPASAEKRNASSLKLPMDNTAINELEETLREIEQQNHHLTAML